MMWFFYGCLALLMCLFFFALFIDSRNRVRLDAENKRLNDAWRHYQDLLRAIETEPSDPTLRRSCLDAGRFFCALCREGGRQTVFDELAIKNDIDAASAAAGATITAMPEVANVTTGKHSESSEINDTAKSSTKNESFSSALLGSGCAASIVVIGIVLAIACYPPPRQTEMSVGTQVAENPPVGRPKVQQVKRSGSKDRKTPRKISTATTQAFEKKTATATTDTAVNENTGAAATTKRTKLTWGSLFSGIEELGFRPSVRWKKSRVEKGWIGIYHLPNSDAPDGVLNEVSLLFVGETDRKISKVDVEAEIYDRKHKATTIKNCIACLTLLEAPNEVVEALRREKTKKVGRWQITRKSHPTGGGYDVTCTRTYGGKAKSKEDGNQKKR